MCRQFSLLGTQKKPIDQIPNVPGRNGYVLSRLRTSTQESCYQMNQPRLLTTVFLFSMPRMEEHRAAPLIYNKIRRCDGLTIYQLEQDALVNCRRDRHVNVLPSFLFSLCPLAAAHKVCFTLYGWGLHPNNQFKLAWDGING
jgi:hypothetical protein